MSVKTNVGQKFLRLLDILFPKGSLHPVINRSIVKLSYRCMPNMNSKISNHNKKLLESKEEEPKCNCRNKAECPLPGGV